MIALARCGHHTEAIEMIRSRTQKTPRSLLQVAWCYALSAAALGYGKSNAPAAPDELMLRQHYADAAITAIEQAIELGYTDLAEFESDPDLDAIRGHPGYAALIAKLE